jgi:hypothetical protein
VKGSQYHLIVELYEIKLKALEEAIDKEDLEIDESHIIGLDPYIVVTCKDEEKGKILMDRLQREIPRFLAP